MVPDRKEDLLRELNEMQEKMDTTLDYWGCRRNSMTCMASDDAVSKDASPQKERHSMG